LEEKESGGERYKGEKRAILSGNSEGAGGPPRILVDETEAPIQKIN